MPIENFIHWLFNLISKIPPLLISVPLLTACLVYLYNEHNEISKLYDEESHYTIATVTSTRGGRETILLFKFTFMDQHYEGSDSNRGTGVSSAIGQKMLIQFVPELHKDLFLTRIVSYCPVPDTLTIIPTEGWRTKPTWCNR